MTAVHPVHPCTRIPVCSREERQLTDQPLVARLEALLSDHFEIDPEALRPDATFRDLAIDSLAMAEILAILDDEDGITLPASLPGLGADTTLADGFRIIAEAAAEARAQEETAGAVR